MVWGKLDDDVMTYEETNDSCDHAFGLGNWCGIDGYLRSISSIQRSNFLLKELEAMVVEALEWTPFTWSAKTEF